MKVCPTFSYLSVCGVKQEGRAVRGWCRCLRQLLIPFFFIETFPCFAILRSNMPVRHQTPELTGAYVGDHFLRVLFVYARHPRCHVAASQCRVRASVCVCVFEWEGKSKHTPRSQPSWSGFLSADVSFLLPLISEEWVDWESWSCKHWSEVEIVSLVVWNQTGRTSAAVVHMPIDYSFLCTIFSP